MVCTFFSFESKDAFEEFAEEDDKEKEWPELPSWYVKELEADKCLGEGVKDYEICSG